MKKYLIALSIFSIIYFFNGCDSSRKPATGFEDEIYVIADSSDYEEVNESLIKAFEVQINTPFPEKLFILKQITPDQLGNIKNKKNIVIAAELNSNSGASKLIQSIIDDDIKRKINSDKDYIYYAYDLWAKNQLVAIVSGKTIDDVDFKIEKNKDSLRTSFQKESDLRLRESLYNPKFEQKKIESKLLIDYGWIIYAHKDFQLQKIKPKEKFVWFKSVADLDKEKSLFVFWMDSASYLYITPDSVKSIRDRVTKEFYKSNSDSSYIVLIDSLVNTTEVSFNGRFALCTQGLWKNTKNNLVGPFINYLLYDEKKHRIYMLDGSVNAPKYYKRNLIQQVDVMLQSFRTTSDLSDDRIDELIEESFKN